MPKLTICRWSFPIHCAPGRISSPETRLYKSRRAQLADSMAELQDALVSVNKELAITQRLEKSGAASHVEVLRLQRQKSDLGLKITDLRSQYFVQAREALSKANAEVDMLAAILKDARIPSPA
jgi:adhesin transport system membrane fusion protein